jgi:hypothetical protein
MKVSRVKQPGIGEKTEIDRDECEGLNYSLGQYFLTILTAQTTCDRTGGKCEIEEIIHLVTTRKDY